MKIRKIVLTVSILIYQVIMAQGSSLPFLNLNTDARSAGMGNSTIAESKAMYLYTNPTSFLRDTTKNGYASYTSVSLPEFSNEKSTFHAGSLGYKFGKQSLSIGFRYLKGLEFTSTDEFGLTGKKTTPFDCSFDIGYARELKNNFSAFITGAFIESNIGMSSYMSNISTGIYYRNNFKIKEKEVLYTLGLGIYNFGTDIKSTKKTYDQPHSLGFGGSFIMDLAENHTINLALSTRYFRYPTIYDSGITTNLGIEYQLFQLVNIRIGRHIEEGNKLTTLGLGFNYKDFCFNTAYQIGQENTLFLGVNLDVCILKKDTKQTI